MHDDGLIIHQLKVACTNRNLPKSLRQWLMLIGNQLDNIFGAQMLKPACRSSRFSMESSRPEATSGKGTGGEGGEERGATEQRNCWFVFGIHLSESKQTRCIGFKKSIYPWNLFSGWFQIAPGNGNPGCCSENCRCFMMSARAIVGATELPKWGSKHSYLFNIFCSNEFNQYKRTQIYIYISIIL